MKLLLDCGWDERFDPSTLGLLKKYAPFVDGVLVSHADLEHMGALPYAFAQLGMECPVLCTAPVRELGELFVLDALDARTGSQEFDVFGADDVAAAWRRVVPVQYTAKVDIKSRSSGLRTGVRVEAIAAGHGIGGAVSAPPRRRRRPAVTARPRAGVAHHQGPRGVCVRARLQQQ